MKRWLYASVSVVALVIVTGVFARLPGNMAAVGGGQEHRAVPAAENVVATVPHEVRVPILTYHNIRPTPARAMSAADKQYEVTPEQFEEQMAYLESEGYAPVDFALLAAAVKGEKELPAKPVIVTLDDGRESQYENAFPVLKKHGLKATFFVFSNAIGRPGYLTAAQIKELQDAGMEIGSHTRYHQFLTRMEKDEDVRDELSISKKALEEITGRPVTVLAYPFGLHDERVERLAGEAGYETARGLAHVRTHRPEDLLKLGSFITTGDESYFRMILSTP